MTDLEAAWWCRLDSNQRQRDYESRALPPELRHRGTESYRAACARAFSLRFFTRRLWSATRFLLFTTSPENYGAGPGPAPRMLVGWLRRSDSNRRPSGYEPDELPLLHSAERSIPPPMTPTLNAEGQRLGVADGVGEAGDGEGATVTRYTRS